MLQNRQRRVTNPPELNASKRRLPSEQTLMDRLRVAKQTGHHPRPSLQQDRCSISNALGEVTQQKYYGAVDGKLSWVNRLAFASVFGFWLVGLQVWE
jgi:hypothetical protein